MQTACRDISPLTLLTTFEEVVRELGGITAISRLAGRSRTAVCNWKAARKFPAGEYPTIRDALIELGYRPDMRLFTFRNIRADRPVVDVAV